MAGRTLVVAFGLLCALAGAAAAQPLGADGQKAFQMARAADDQAQAARDEGERALGELEKVLTANPRVTALEPLRAQAAAGHQALLGYRRVVQASVGEALALLADLTRKGGAAGAPREAGARDVIQQRALLAAHEAAVMAARARTETERLRALLAEARLALTTARPREAAEPRAPVAGEVTVPNLIGARLPEATRDLAAAGLKLGATAGPPDGYVVKQTPEPGAIVPREAAVALTLSGTAAGVTVSPPR